MNTALPLTYPAKPLQTDDISLNTRRLALISDQRIHEADVFSLFGWTDLPDALRSVIRSDMEAYRDELLGLYSTCDAGVRNRRKSVSYWIRAYRDGICSEQTAINALTCTIGA
jgi:hypothetical protein